MPRKIYGALVALLAFVLPRGGLAQEAGERWEFVVAPYFLIPHTNGTVGIGSTTSDVDADPGDLFELLQFGFMLYAEAHEPRWGASLDGFYMELARDGEKLATRLEAYQAAVEVTGYWRLEPWAEALAGGRVNFLGGTVQVGDPLNREISDDKVFFDPFVGVRLTLPDTEKWHFSLRADIGGFGAGSDLAWQVYPVVGYRISGLVGIGAAYRVLSTDYSDDSDGGSFVYDVTTFGPEIGATFHF